MSFENVPVFPVRLSLAALSAIAADVLVPARKKRRSGGLGDAAQVGLPVAHRESIC